MESYPGAIFDSERFDPDIYWFSDRDQSVEGVSYSLAVKGINNKSFSVDQIEEEYYQGGMESYSHFHHQYINYGFRGDSVYQVKMKDLFIKGYEPVLNSALIKAMKTIDDPNLDCTNPESYLKTLHESFTISPKGLVFYLAAEEAEEDYMVELLLPYSAVKGIINKKSVLSEFVK